MPAYIAPSVGYISLGLRAREIFLHWVQYIPIFHAEGLNVIVINHMRGLYGIYKSRDTRAKPEWQGFMNRVQTERWFFIARKYCVLSRYVANHYINVFPANTFFNDAYQTIADIQFIATGRVAPVMGYKFIILYVCVYKKIVIE